MCLVASKECGNGKMKTEMTLNTRRATCLAAFAVQVHINSDGSPKERVET
jgi:hypothetical protein